MAPLQLLIRVYYFWEKCEIIQTSVDTAVKFQSDIADIKV